MDNIIQFPTPEQPQKELTYSETFDAFHDTIQVLETFYRKGEKHSPLEVYEAIVEMRIEEKYMGGAACRE